MFNKRDKISIDSLFIWLSIYMITAIPAYLKLYETVFIGLIIILGLEEVVCYYLFQDEILDSFIDGVKKPGITLGLLAISMLIMIISLIWALFYKWEFVALLTVTEVSAYLIRTMIKTKSSRDS